MDTTGVWATANLVFIHHLKNGKGVLSLWPSENFLENENPFSKHPMTHAVCRCVQLKGRDLVLMAQPALSHHQPQAL